MKAYIYHAALICEDCAACTMGEEKKPDHVNMDDQASYDSDEWPKGPYGDGGGEADSPQHCDMCGDFLENPLTEDGSTYVKQAWREYVETGRGRLEVLQAWRDGYAWEWEELCIEYEDAGQDPERLKALAGELA